MISCERKCIGYSLWRDISNVERSITSTMNDSFLPTTDRDLSITTHLAEGNRMKSEYQQLLHLMSYES